MPSRGLPGFLRRSRRWNDFDDEDEENEDDDADDQDNEKNNNQATGEKQRQYQRKQQQQQRQQQEDVMESTFTASLQFLDPSPLAESAAKEDTLYNNTTSNRGGEEPHGHHNHDDEEDDDEGYHSGGNRSVSTLGDIDPATPHNTAFSGSRSSSSNNVGSNAGPTYRQIQFEKILSNNVVKLSELRKVSWNGIPVSDHKQQEGGLNLFFVTYCMVDFK
jgi:hypothetical protein